jgi:hypothetical protein
VDDQIEIAARQIDVHEVALNDVHVRAVETEERPQDLEPHVGVVDAGHVSACPAVQREQAIVRPAGPDLQDTLAGEVAGVSPDHPHECAVPAELGVERRQRLDARCPAQTPFQYAGSVSSRAELTTLDRAAWSASSGRRSRRRGRAAGRLPVRRTLRAPRAARRP